MAFRWTQEPGAFLTAGGRQLEYCCFGDRPQHGPVIVMLHEGLGSVALWRDFPQKIAHAIGAGVVAYSRAGYGQSDAADLPRSLDYMTREAMTVLPDVLDAIGAKKYILLGHSDGATIAAIHGGSVEDFRVRGLILMAPHFFTEPGGLASIAEAKAAFEAGDLKAKMAKYHRDPEATFRGWNDAWLDPGFKAWNVADVIDYFRIPVLAIQGADDQYGTRAQIDEVANRSYAPVDVEIIPDCRHSPFIDRPAATLAAITEFVLRLNRIEAAEVEIA